MTREQLIECMAEATYGGRAAWEGADEADRVTWRSSMRKALDALPAAGMVIVPREPSEAMIEAGVQAFCLSKKAARGCLNDAFRAMTEAANG